MSEYDLRVHQLVDQLQIPLQPYRDNLEAEVYDIFERDELKYNEYELAFLEAFPSWEPAKTVVCYYVGSGKGLILDKLMRAVKKSKRMVKVYCIEKNPFPIQTLKRRIARNKWGKFVEVVQTDIRNYNMPESPDLVFSELLGGIGDNELSPECLRWAEKYPISSFRNCRKDTVCIPQKYTCFIRPISAHHLHRQLSPEEQEHYFTVEFGKSYSPFQSQSVWEFVHPLPAEDSLERSARVTWKAKEEVCLQGFEGSFDCHLFGKAYFSIVPENRDRHFYSWFPLFFSFSEEALLAKGEEISIEFVRCSSPARIWYKWRFAIAGGEGEVRMQSRWHNEGARLAVQLGGV
jgi:type II protein arginine methyltransferase